MPAYAILQQSRDLGAGVRIFKIILRANDGYQEIQTIKGDASVLREAARSFHAARVASQAPEPTDNESPVFVDVPLA